MSNYITAQMQAYAEGYHDGRMAYDPEPYSDDDMKALYMQGYENGSDDRTEQDERG